MRKAVLVLGLKGGVGKTLVSVATALKLSEDKDVVLIDADLDSPNLAKMMGVETEIEVETDKLIPAKVGNINIFSMSLVAKDKAISMSGSSYTQLLADVIDKTDWAVNAEDCYIVVDCPAGASDIFRSLVEVFGSEMAGAIVVTQPASYDDMERMIKLLNYFRVPILGIVDNMAYFQCPRCGEIYHIFGKPKGKKYAAKYGVSYLGQIPLSQNIREIVENGMTIIPDEMLEVTDNIFDRVKNAEVKKISLTTRIKEKAIEKLRLATVKIITKMVLRANRELPIAQLQTKYGLGGNIIELIVHHRGDIVIQSYFIIKKGLLKVVKNPKKVDISISMSLEIFLATVRGKLDIEDAFYMGEIEVYGSGASVRALYFFRKVWKVIEEEANKILTDEGVVED